MWQCGFEFLLSDILVVFFSMCSIAASSNHSFVLFKSPLHQPPSSRCLDQIQAPMPYVGCPQFVVGSRLCSERFFFGYSGFPFSSKTNTFKFRFQPGMVDKESLCGWATTKSLFLFYFFSSYSTITVL